MADPTFFDYLRYGPGAQEAADRRARTQNARQTLLTLAELEAVAANQPDTGGAVTADGLRLNLPQPEFGPREQAAMQQALLDLGVNPQQFAAAREINTRRAALEDVLREIENPAQRAAVINQGDAAPVRLSGGVAYRPFAQTPDDAILAESSAVRGLGERYTADAADQELRNQTLKEFLDDPTSDPLLQVDAANNKQLTDIGEVEIETPDGNTELRVARLNPDGTVRYELPVTPAGAPLRTRKSGGSGAGTALQQDTRFIAQTLELPEPEALRLKLSLKGKAPADAWAEIVRETARSQYGRYARDEKTLLEQAGKIWRVAFPDKPIPSDLPEEVRTEIDTAAATPVVSPETTAPSAAPAAPDAAEIEARARKDGYANFGKFVPGKGLEVFNAQGQLIGHYY